MTRTRVFLVVLTLAVSLPLAAQNFPTDADRPSGNDNCEEVCEKQNDAAGNAITNLEQALAAWEADSFFDVYAGELQSVVNGLQSKRAERCHGRRTFQPNLFKIRKLIEEIMRKRANPGPMERLRAAEEWLTVAKAWEEVFRRCLEMNLFEKNTEIDFTNDIPEAELRRLLERSLKEVRKNTRDALLRSSGIPCSEENRRLLLALIDGDGSLR
jgi:hypothetical protein